MSRDARRLLRGLGDSLPEPMQRPVLVALSGLPGTGKSYFAQRLAERVPLAVLESDALRKALVRTPRYTAWESTRLFRALHELIDILLAQGIPVLLDATNAQETHREPLYEIAGGHGAEVVLIRLDAPEEVVRQRLQGRTARGRRDSSDADWEVYQRLRATWEPIGREHLVVDTSQDIGPAVEKAAAEIERLMR